MASDLMHDDHKTEQVLLQQAKAGDYLAFDALHTRLEPAIMRFVRRLIGHTQEAEDIVQDTFLALFTHMERIRPDENIRPYVFRIARNRCYDVLRRQGRFEHLSLDDEPVNIRISFDLAEKEGAPPPEDVTHWLLLKLEVQEAMDKLPELQRQALILYSEEEMTYAEIAAIMDVSVGTIKSRIFHAKKNLRRQMKPETLAAISMDAPSTEETLSNTAKIEPDAPHPRKTGQKVQSKPTQAEDTPHEQLLSSGC